MCSTLTRATLALSLLGASVTLADATEPAPISDGPRAIDPGQFQPAPLAASATVDLRESSLRELVDWLKDDRGLAVVVHQRALEELGLSSSDRISDRLDDSPLYQLLDRLRLHDLDWWYRDEVLHLSTVEDAYDRLVTSTYNLGELIEAGYDADSLIETITSTVAADTWAENGGGEAELHVIGDVLFVSQTDRVQRQIGALLAALGDHGRRTMVGEPPEHLELRERLDAVVSVAFDGTPLSVALDELAAASGADIRLDRRALRDVGIREREPVRIAVDDRSLETVLGAILADLDLTWVLQDGVLRVTNLDALLKVAVYDVRDLCRDEAESEALIEAITSQTDADTWAENGGGEAEIRGPRPGTLVISQSEQVHDRVLRLLETYRQALRSSKPRDDFADDGETVETVYYRVFRSTGEDLAAALKRLVRPGTWKSDESPDAVGEITLVSSEPDRVRETKDESPATIERSVLIVRQTRDAHGEIREVLRRVATGDPTSQPGGGGGGGLGGGGFGSGYFAVPAADR